MSLETVSFNGWKTFKFCGWKFKLEKQDKVRLFIGNEFSAFGQAIHKTTEQLVLREKENEKNGGIKDDSFDPIEFFLKTFSEEINLIKEKSENKFEFKQELIKEMIEQGKELVPMILPALTHYFGKFSFISSEQEIRLALSKALDILKDEKKLTNENLTDFHRYNRLNNTNRRWKVSYS